MNLENLTQKELVGLQKKISKELKGERFVNENFINILNIKKKHHTLEKKLKENIEVVFEEIEEHLKNYKYNMCPHLSYENLSIHIYNGTEKDSAYLHLDDFKIVHITDNFDKDLLKIIEYFLSKGENAK